jgi:4-amino-4-deoxy-L-arabinose transferase-like glycosyltransferase
MLLIWYWAYTVWDAKVAQKTLIIFISMPSLYLLASWAYTDFALTFFGLAGIYAVFRGCQDTRNQPQTGWFILAGVFSGMAMGVKYTSFLVPVSILILIILWNRKNLVLAAKSGAIFVLITVVVASPWYIRNWVVMGNPFYPFAFGGLFWDDFRADWYAQLGTGIGWNLGELLLMPLNATLGHHDANYFDGRIGPLYLILAPMTLFSLLTLKNFSKGQNKSLGAILLFSLVSFMIWSLGIINSSALWQTRLLYPALIPFALPTAFGLLAIGKLDTPKLKLSFIFYFFLVIVIAINLIEAGIFTIQRNPLAHVIGIESAGAYLNKVQPAYAQAVEMLEGTPGDAVIYMLFEPRSYYMNRDVQPDPILDNFSHDYYLYNNPENIIKAWDSNGYTHLLINRLGLDFLASNFPKRLSSEHQTALSDIIRDFLTPIEIFPDGAYALYEIIYE